jgi:hypothetical protein
MNNKNNFVSYAGVWHTWDDHTGNEIAVPVIVIGEFYEEGDPRPGYNVEIAESVYGYIKGNRIGGIENVIPSH